MSLIPAQQWRDTTSPPDHKPSAIVDRVSVPPSALEQLQTRLGRDLVHSEALAVFTAEAIGNIDALMSIAKQKLAVNPEAAPLIGEILAAYTKNQARHIEGGY